MEQIEEGEMSGGEIGPVSGLSKEPDDILKQSKKDFKTNNIPQPTEGSDSEHDDDVLAPDSEDDAEEVCLTRADIREMQRIHEELEQENEKLKSENERLSGELESTL